MGYSRINTIKSMQKNTDKIHWLNTNSNFVGLGKEKRQMLAIATLGKHYLSEAINSTSVHTSGDISPAKRKSLRQSGMRPTLPSRCYIPKKLIHTWAGHKKGVQKILWIPETADLLLSCG